MDKGQYKARTWRISYNKSVRVDNTIFRRLPYIRVLDLTGSLIQNIPDCIGRLIHLRLLDLDETDISYLPESIVSLINLEILNLQRCGALHCLPLGITRLCNLRRLGLAGTPINQVPKGIGKLKFLNDLEGFPAGGGSDKLAKVQDGWNLEELAPLVHLRKLKIIKLERAAPLTTDSLLINKRHLKELIISCTEETDEQNSEEDVINIEMNLELLIPPQNLEDLTIYRLFGHTYSSWLGSCSHLSSLIYLKLIDCESCVHLPPIGQLPNLKYLKIVGATAVTKIGPEVVGHGVGNPGSAGAVGFPKLETLVIENMPNWEEWNFVVAEGKKTVAAGGGGEKGEEHVAPPPPTMRLLPCLKVLQLFRCPKLRALPRQLGEEATSLSELQLSEMDGLKVVEDLPFLSGELIIVGCEGLERVSNLPQARELRVSRCPNLKRVEELESLERLWLDADSMEDLSSLWLPGLKQQRKRRYGEEEDDLDLDVYTWPRDIE